MRVPIISVMLWTKLKQKHKKVAMKNIEVLYPGKVYNLEVVINYYTEKIMETFPVLLDENSKFSFQHLLISYSYFMPTCTINIFKLGSVANTLVYSMDLHLVGVQ